MKIRPVLAISVSIAIMGCVSVGGPVSDVTLGLSKTSVFDDPAPAVFVYDDTKARYSEAMPRAFYGAPPQVPHEMEELLPITLDDNQCLECHDRPDMIGQEEVKGGNPMDKMHYSSQGEMNSEDGWALSGARYTCNQCHVAQADVAPLVGNTFATSE